MPSAEPHTYRWVDSRLVTEASLTYGASVVDAAREILQEISL
jgi:hypothetical protein